MLAAVASLLVLVPAARALDWEIEQVDDAINWIGGRVSIAVAQDGTPHIGHGMHPSEVIYYAVKQGDAWTIETADSYPSGLCASIALDPGGNPCLSYYKSTYLTFARRVGDTWAHETIDPMHFDSGTALCVSSEDVPHIAYCKSGDPWSLKYASKPADDWLVETVDTTPAAGNDINMVLDDAGNPHISHWGAPNYGAGPFQARYSHWDGSTWNTDVIDDTVQNLNVFQTGIALDADGNPHIAYFTHEWGPSNIKYAVWDGDQWNITNIDRTDDSSAACDLVLDRTGSPHVVYGTGYVQSGGSSELRYAYMDDRGDWVVEVIDADGDAGEINSLALDPQGYLHVAYFRGPGTGQGGEIRYARSTTPVGGCVGDLDGDGATDQADLGVLLADWGCVADCVGDLDGDDDTDQADLGILLADWGCGT
jgi:hypothetical protein